MATLYFRWNTANAGAAYTWDDPLNWWTSISFATHAGGLPASTDTVYICDNVSQMNALTSVTVATAYFGTTSPAYYGTWDGSGFNFNVNFNCTNLYIPYGYINVQNGSFNVSTLTSVTGLSFIEASTFNQNGGSINFHDGSTLGQADSDGYVNLYSGSTANFYDNSANGSGGNNNGVVTSYGFGGGNINFYNNSTNSQSNDGGGTDGYVYGNAYFHNNSTNASSYDVDGNTAGAPGHVINGNATFYDSATNYSFTDSSAQASGTVSGSIIYTYPLTLTQVQHSIQSAAGASSVTLSIAGGGGVPLSNVLLTELLKLPFPIVL